LISTNITCSSKLSRRLKLRKGLGDLDRLVEMAWISSMLTQMGMTKMTMETRIKKATTMRMIMGTNDRSDNFLTNLLIDQTFSNVSGSSAQN